MKGIARGYLNSSPFEALIEAIVTQTISNIHNVRRSGIPTIIRQRGAMRTVYSSIESWKLREALPFSFTHVDSSRRLSQQIKGPRIPPKGKIKQAKDDK